MISSGIQSLNLHFILFDLKTYLFFIKFGRQNSECFVLHLVLLFLSMRLVFLSNYQIGHFCDSEMLVSILVICWPGNHICQLWNRVRLFSREAGKRAFLEAQFALRVLLDFLSNCTNKKKFLWPNKPSTVNYFDNLWDIVINLIFVSRYQTTRSSRKRREVLGILLRF